MVSDVQVESRADRADGIVAIDATRGLALDEKQTVRVQIRNDLVPAGSVIVSVVSLTRPEYVLGAVQSNEVREFLIDTTVSRWVQTRGEARWDQETTDLTQIDVYGQARVKWNLGIGLIRVERLEVEDES